MTQIPDRLRLYGQTAQAFAAKHRLKERVHLAFTKYRFATYSALGALGLLLLILIASSGNSDTKITPAGAIEQVLARDRELSIEGRKAVKGGQSPRQAVVSVVQGMKAIDLRDCPPDFREAYARHASAWDAMAAELRQQPETFGEGFMLGLGNMLARGEVDGGQQRLAQLRDRRLEDIRVSWAEVEAMAARHGAMLPPPIPGD